MVQIVTGNLLPIEKQARSKRSREQECFHSSPAGVTLSLAPRFAEARGMWVGKKGLVPSIV